MMIMMAGVTKKKSTISTKKIVMEKLMRPNATDVVKIGRNEFNPWIIFS